MPEPVGAHDRVDLPARSQDRHLLQDLPCFSPVYLSLWLSMESLFLRLALAMDSE